MRYLTILIVSLLLSACVDRTVSEIVPSAASVGTPKTVFASTTRAREPDGGYGFERGDTLKFLEMTVSIPPSHTPGELDFSYANPKPEREFVLANVTEFDSVQDFGQQLRDENGKSIEEVIIFVHGYNSTQTETAFRAAQLTHDVGIPGATMIYSWPSRAQAYGYAYDIDSMLFARDGLEKTIRALKAMGVKRIILLAHSMGSALSMEMMRQADLREPGWADRTLDGVMLISPDLDVDVFRSQMESISALPKPFVIMVSQKDKALNFSARLRGTSKGDRLGSIDSIDAIADLPVDVIDTTAFNRDAQSSHFVAATSPAMLSILGSLREVSNTFGPERGMDALIPVGARNQTGANEVVLTGTGTAEVNPE